MNYVSMFFDGLMKFLIESEYIPYKFEHMLLIGLGAGATSTLFALCTESRRRKEYASIHYHRRALLQKRQNPAKFHRPIQQTTSFA